jgi:DNA processing protein
VDVVAIVGTREAGHHGLRVAHRLAEDLAARGIWIVSGLATGIDGAAHGGCLASGRAGTLAVLGCGIDVPYPLEHVDLKEEIAQTGGVLSEHPPGTSPQPGLFPRRNRLVAALARAVVVVEAPLRSGALITAQLALEMGREVLAVPGPFGNPSYVGCHKLLKRGEASLCESAEDVLAALCDVSGRPGRPGGPRGDPAPRPPPPAGAPLALWGVLGESEVLSPDDLRLRTGLAAEEVAGALAILEVEGYVARVPGLGVRRT